MTPHRTGLAGFLVLSLIKPDAQAAPTKFEQPNAYAVVIGISQYRRNHVNDWLRMRVKPDSMVYICSFLCFESRFQAPPLKNGTGL